MWCSVFHGRIEVLFFEKITFMQAALYRNEDLFQEYNEFIHWLKKNKLRLHVGDFHERLRAVCLSPTEYTSIIHSSINRGTYSDRCYPYRHTAEPLKPWVLTTQSAYAICTSFRCVVYTKQSTISYKFSIWERIGERRTVSSVLFCEHIALTLRLESATFWL